MSGYQAGSDDRGGLHLWGTPSAPPKSFHGPTPYSNTIGESIDKSPNCSVCLDGSSNCTNASAHASSSGGSTPPSSGGSNPPSSGGSTPPSSGGSNPPSGGGSNPTPTPTYHACGVHETSVSGDHSLQLSCSSTDSNGNYCTVTNFYACDSHTHSYPAPPPTPTPTPPPPPTTVACGARGWTGCTIRSSDGNACLWIRVIRGVGVITGVVRHPVSLGTRPSHVQAGELWCELYQLYQRRWHVFKRRLYLA